MPRDRILIEDLEVECVVGVNTNERQHEQPLRINIELGLDLSAAGRSGRISDTCNYDRVADEVITLLRFRRYRLLEVAAEEVAAMLFGVHPGLDTVGLTIAKPRALAGRAGAAAVKILRRAEDFLRRHETSRFGRVEILLETAEAGLYLLHVEPGRSITPHLHRVMHELEWLVSGELDRDGVPLTGLCPIEWPRGQVHEYTNRSGRLATLFCCDRPPFIVEDEILVDAAGREVAP